MHSALALFNLGVHQKAAFFSYYSSATMTAGNTSLQDIQKHFTMSLQDASKSIGIGTTALKVLCRFYGISRWPYRKVKILKNSFFLISS